MRSAQWPVAKMRRVRVRLLCFLFFLPAVASSEAASTHSARASWAHGTPPGQSAAGSRQPAVGGRASLSLGHAWSPRLVERADVAEGVAAERALAVPELVAAVVAHQVPARHEQAVDLVGEAQLALEGLGQGVALRCHGGELRARGLQVLLRRLGLRARSRSASRS